MRHKMYRQLMNWLADIHSIKHFPFFAWDIRTMLVSWEEALHGLSFVQAGDIGLHRDRGYLSNMAIPGAMKHAWMFTGKQKGQFGEFEEIVEAISEGVLSRSALYPLHTDYALILRPQVSTEAKTIAVERVKALVSLRSMYDVYFKFDLEIADELFQDKDTVQENFKKYNIGFSCTETVAFGYIGHRRKLGLYRTKHRGKQVILPDAFITTKFDVVWCSDSFTPDVAKKMRICEEGLDMISDYWNRCK